MVTTRALVERTMFPEAAAGQGPRRAKRPAPKRKPVARKRPAKRGARQ